MSDILDRLTSRKFLLTIATCVYIGVQAAAGTITTTEAIDGIWKIVVGYMVAEGAADAAGRLKPSLPTDPAPKPPEEPVPAGPVPPPAPYMPAGATTYVDPTTTPPPT